MTQLSHSYIPVIIRVTQSVNKSLNNVQFHVSTQVIISNLVKIFIA